jgi:hypothetical protein
VASPTALNGVCVYLVMCPKKPRSGNPWSLDMANKVREAACCAVLLFSQKLVGLQFGLLRRDAHWTTKNAVAHTPAQRTYVPAFPIRIVMILITADPPKRSEVTGPLQRMRTMLNSHPIRPVPITAIICINNMNKRMEGGRTDDNGCWGCVGGSLDFLRDVSRRVVVGHLRELILVGKHLWNESHTVH